MSVVPLPRWDTDWIKAAPIGSKPDTTSTWAVLSRYFLEDFSMGLAMQKETGNTFFRTKHSE